MIFDTNKYGHLIFFFYNEDIQSSFTTGIEHSAFECLVFLGFI